MANNPYVNKVQMADGTPVIDISDTTAVASDVAQGKYFYLATGEKAIGVSSGGSGGIIPTGTKYISISQNGTTTEDVTNYASAEITVDVSGGGGGITPAPERDVNFIDYDGTIVYSYSASDFLALSALPANPTHDGLTAQGWNWTLTDAKTYVTSYGKLWIGQMYITTSGDTEIDVVMQKGRLSPTLNLAVNGTVTVDWGDNTASDTVTGTSTSTRKNKIHAYASPGNYTIKIHVVEGEFVLYATINYGFFSAGTNANLSYVYTNCVRAVRFGNGLSLAGNSFRLCSSLMSVTLPSNITSIGNIAFYGCCNLASIVIPNNVTIIPQTAFYNCYCIKSVAIPNSVVGVDQSAFGYCYSLHNVTLPNRVSDIGNTVFQYCNTLSYIAIPNSVASIGDNAFAYCRSIARLTIPSSVTSIGASAFNSAYGIAEYHFESSTPPTLGSTNVFSGIPSDCVIYVPYSADHSILNAYKTATNWSTYASYMQEEP